MLAEARDLIIDGDPFALPMPADNPIFAEIETLLSSDSTPSLDVLENTLTSGYAAALALEAERWRLERRIAEVAAKLSDMEGRGKTQELTRLARRLNTADADLAELRGLLATLRARTDAARAAA
jgi:predicted component of type VI protein secretion system